MPVSLTPPDQLNYQGDFRGFVESIPGEVCGSARVIIGNEGLPEIAVSIEAGSSSSDLLDKAYATNGLMNSTRRVKWIAATVVSPNGVFRVTERPFLRARDIAFGGSAPQPQFLRLGSHRAVFEQADSKPVRYWLLPLYNLIWETGPRRYPELDSHPLWLPHNQSRARATDAQAGFPPSAIGFLFDGKPAFIQRISAYDDVKRQLEDGLVRHAITAIMIGEIGERSFDFPLNDPASWFPMHLLSWLSLSVGCTVGAPWIELLDDSGNLVRRIHHKFSQPDFRPGIPRIDNIWNPDSIGYLLTKALTSPCFGIAVTAIPLLLANESIIRGGSLEYDKVQLTRAFEHLGKHFGLGAIDLSASLAPAVKSKMTAIIGEAAGELRLIAQGLLATERAALERIADRMRGASGKENSFGSVVRTLAERFGFSDPKVLDKHFAINPAGGCSTWEGTLSFYRGAVIHEGFFALDSAGGKYSTRDLAAIIYHLQDLLIRILLKMIEYDGPYRSIIRGELTPVPIDWVKLGQPASELGFGIDRSV